MILHFTNDLSLLVNISVYDVLSSLTYIKKSLLLFLLLSLLLFPFYFCFFPLVRVAMYKTYIKGRKKGKLLIREKTIVNRVAVYAIYY